METHKPLRIRLGVIARTSALLAIATFALALVAVVASAFAPPTSLAGQDFKSPLGISHFVYRPAEDIAPVEEIRAWTFGVGLLIGSAERQARYGFAAHATYGSPYWYVAGSAGMWNGGSPNADDFGMSLKYHYNVFQSRDYRTRLGPQFGWSTASVNGSRTHAIDYRAVVSYTVSPRLSLYGGVGAETVRNSTLRGDSTDPTVIGGLNFRLSQGFAFSTGFESAFAELVQLRVAGSVQFEPTSESGLDERLHRELSGRTHYRPR